MCVRMYVWMCAYVCVSLSLNLVKYKEAEHSTVAVLVSSSGTPLLCMIGTVKRVELPEVFPDLNTSLYSSAWGWGGGDEEEWEGKGR